MKGREMEGREGRRAKEGEEGKEGRGRGRKKGRENKRKGDKGKETKAKEGKGGLRKRDGREGEKKEEKGGGIKNEGEGEGRKEEKGKESGVCVCGGERLRKTTELHHQPTILGKLPPCCARKSSLGLNLTTVNWVWAVSPEGNQRPGALKDAETERISPPPRASTRLNFGGSLPACARERPAAL